MTANEPIAVPFTILVDSAEQQSWRFTGLKADARQNYRPLMVTTAWRCLGRHPNSLGDYSIEGFQDRVAIERKSVDDCRGTVLGWPKKEKDGTTIQGASRRERFESELTNLAKIHASVVIVEGSLYDVCCGLPEEVFGAKPREVVAKILFRSILAFQMDYKVPWIFCETARMAESAAFRWLERYYRHMGKAK